MTHITLRHVVSYHIYYTNQQGNQRQTRPNKLTRNGVELTDEYALPYDVEYPKETFKERAIRLNAVDIWTVVLDINMIGSSSYTLKGTAALSCYKQLNERLKQLKLE